MRAGVSIVAAGFLAVAGSAGGVSRLTHTPTDDDEPCFSPDGRSIVYQSRDASGRTDLWVVGLDGGNPERITAKHGYSCFPSWSPDGQRIVFASDSDRDGLPPDDPRGDYDLYSVAREDGRWSAPRRLTDTPHVREYLPAYSPDGQQLAFTAALPTRRRMGDTGVFVMAPESEAPQTGDTRGVQNVGEHFDFTYAGRQIVIGGHAAVEPSWSHDATLLAYTLLHDWAAGHQCRVSIADADAFPAVADASRTLSQLEGFPSYGAAFSPADDLLAFVMSCGEAWDLWLLPAPYTGPPIRLTDHPANDVNPAWSPDGRRIAFASNRRGPYDIYVLTVPDAAAVAAESRAITASLVQRAAAWGKARPREDATAPAVARARPAQSQSADGKTGDLPARLSAPDIVSTPGEIIRRDWQALVDSGSASRNASDDTRWTVLDRAPAGRGPIVPAGPAIHAGVDHDVPDLRYDPRLEGWHAVFVGLYLPPDNTYNGVAARLDGETAYRCLADPRASLADRGEGYESFLDADFVEVELTRADLTGRRIEIHHPEGCRSTVTHFRFVPLDEKAAAAAEAFAARRPLDVHLWLDIFDYAHLPLQRERQNDWWQNSSRGIHRLVRYFCDYGANCLGYRFMAGGRARYPSRALAGERERYIDKRIAPDMRPWLSGHRYGDVEIDLLAEWVRWTHFYGKRAFATWCFEESHGYWFLSSFNLEHPQFLSRRRDGTFQLACASLAYPEVMEHKLAIAREVLERGIDGFHFDFQRIAGWHQRRDMTHHHKGLGGWDKGFDAPAVEAYRERYGVDPRTEPANHRRWVTFSTAYRTDFFRALRALCDATGRRIEIVVTLPAVSRDPYTAVSAYGVNWPALVDEGLIDAFAPIIPPTGPDGTPQTLDDVAAIMDTVHERCRGRCKVLWPLAYYKRTVSGLAANSGLSVPDYTERILEHVQDRGAAGVSLTTVDYNMTATNQQVHIDTVMRLNRLLSGKPGRR